jgi:flagellar assembly protein FliH
LALGHRSGGLRSQRIASLDPLRADTPSRASAEDAEQAAFCRGFSDGERKGYEQGESDGREAALKQIESVLQALRLLLTELEALRRREVRHLEKEAVELALAVARKVAGQEIAARPEGVASLVRDGIRRLEHAGALMIRMNPADLERLSDVPSQLLDGLADPGRVRFEADASISAGGCFIESDAGAVDARVERRFQIVEEALRAEGRADDGDEGLPA